jgi:hypothetical protein
LSSSSGIAEAYRWSDGGSGWLISGPVVIQWWSRVDVFLICFFNSLIKKIGLNSLYTHVLYDIYFLPHQLHFLPNLVPVVYEKTEMVPPSNFPSKTNVQPHHPIGIDVYAQHLSPWHTSTLTWLPYTFFNFNYYYLNDFFYTYMYQKKKKSGVAQPPSRPFLGMTEPPP